MRPVERIEIFLSKVADLWRLFPDMRFSQIVILIEDEVRSRLGVKDIFYVEETELAKVINEVIEEKKRRNFK
jgi:hypothetical protein